MCVCVCLSVQKSLWQCREDIKSVLRELSDKIKEYYLCFLKVIRRLPRNALCESVLFGFPLIILPTVCWKIDWEVLEKNQQNFISLCQELLTKVSILYQIDLLWNKTTVLAWEFLAVVSGIIGRNVWKPSSSKIKSSRWFLFCPDVWDVI